MSWGGGVGQQDKHHNKSYFVYFQTVARAYVQAYIQSWLVESGNRLNNILISFEYLVQIAIKRYIISSFSLRFMIKS